MSGTPRRGDHEGFDELAVGWALHALEPEDETLFAAHLAGCTRCAQTVAETAAVLAAMADDLPRAEPSATAEAVTGRPSTSATNRRAWGSSTVASASSATDSYNVTVDAACPASERRSRSQRRDRFLRRGSRRRG